MSEWRRVLKNRRDELDAAHHHIEEAHDDFLDYEDRDTLDRARAAVEEVIARTDDEIDLADRNWQEVEDHVEEILSLLEDCLETLAEDGLIEYDAEEFRIEPALDDEPDALREVRFFIEQTHSDYWEVRTAIQENIERL